MLSPTPAHGTAVRDSFLATALAADLIAPAQLPRAEAAIPADAETPADAAHALVAAGLLTRFQAERLVAGRTDGFHLGSYVLLEHIGRGPRGQVYRAKHRAMNRTVAVKVIGPEFTRTSEAQATFHREARAAAGLNHPNVVTVYDANEHAGRFYLVLECVDGHDIEMLIRQRGPRPVAEACELVRQAAAGLDHAHAQGITHGDLKPTNLLVTQPSQTLLGPVVKVADFGLARLQTHSTGTPLPGAISPRHADYAAPELTFLPSSADHRADLYSLGAIFYFLLTGQPPFPGGTAAQKAHRHQREQPARIERLRPDVPPPVAALLHQLLAKQPEARPQSAAEVIERLDNSAAAAGSVCFDIMPEHTFGGPGSSGYLVAVPLASVSPWEQITDRAEAPAEPTPTVSQPTPHWAVGTLALGMLAACLAAIVGLVNAMGK